MECFWRIAGAECRYSPVNDSFFSFLGVVMKKKTVLALACSLLLSSFSPVAAWGHHSCYAGVALGWGLTGLFLGSALTSLAYRPPPPPMYPPPVAMTAVTTYPPAVPPGMCRWERYVLDPYGRTLLDRYGHPIKEYALGSCRYPPY